MILACEEMAMARSRRRRETQTQPGEENEGQHGAQRRAKVQDGSTGIVLSRGIQNGISRSIFETERPDRARSLASCTSCV